MNSEIKLLVSTSLRTIDTELKQKFLDNANDKMKNLVLELAKIRHHPDDSKGYSYYKDVFNTIIKIIDDYENENIDNSITEIGLLLNGQNPVYRDIMGSNEDRKNGAEFIKQTSEELYNYLIGVAELEQYE